jgi:hypothetical protein
LLELNSAAVLVDCKAFVIIEGNGCEKATTVIKCKSPSGAHEKRRVHVEHFESGSDLVSWDSRTCGPIVNWQKNRMLWLFSVHNFCVLSDAKRKQA